MMARDLVRLLTEMVGLHGTLAELMTEKLDAIKKADSERVHSITTRETALAEKAVEREGLRRQLTGKILESLGLDPARARNIRLTELADHFSEPRRSQCLRRARDLKDQILEVERLRVTTTLVTKEMLSHLEEVMSVMTGGGRESDLYLPDGRTERVAAANVFEAFG